MANMILKMSNSASAQNVRNLLSFSSKRLGKFLSNLAELPDSICEIQLMNNDAVQASATITCDHTNQTANDTIQIGSMTLTAKDSGAITNQFNIGASDTISAANLAAAINSYSSSLLTASSATAVVTVKAAQAGTMGNAIPIILTQVASGLTTASALTNGVNESAASINHNKF